MQNIRAVVAFLTCTAAVVLILIHPSTSFSFTGDTVPCKGVNVTGYPKMKEQFQRCNTSIYAGYQQRKETPEGYAPLICTVQCAFIEDKLIDTKTGLLNKAGLDNYKAMFDHMPETVRKDIKKAFYDCFDKHKSDVVYQVKKPTECNGITGIAFCIKIGIDGVCNPAEKDEE